MAPFNVETWKSNTGKDPVVNFLADIDEGARDRIIKDFGLIEKYGLVNAFQARILKKLKGFELYEVRDKYNKKVYRILGKIKGSKLVLYHGFIKKSQETPLKEINLALQRAREDK